MSNCIIKGVLSLENEILFKAIKQIEDHAESKFADRSFPDAAFIVEKGAEKARDGKAKAEFRHLPHHEKSVKSSTENSSVNLNQLRNALARVNQVKPAKEGTQAYRKRAKAHLDRHANALLKTRKNKAEVLKIFKEFDIEIEKDD